jgi:WD40 repeat protein
MSDVFISYSQKLPEPTESLAADLGAHGFAYWYDTRLLPTDVFWRVIMKRITDAKAVIVIWSKPAVDSDWVYGEAKLAHEQKKLVCVRTEDVSPHAIPIPFNGYNVSPVADRTHIFAALQKLEVPVSRKGGFTPSQGDPVLASPAIAAADRAASEIAIAWAEIRESNDREDIEAFLAHYGDAHSFFSRMARKRLARLGGNAAAVAAASEPAAARLPATAKAEIAAAAEDVLLRIEAGMHTAAIGRISLNAHGRLLATGSDDKTVRLWSLPDGKLERTLRPPVGQGDDGKVYAVALAPDGRWVAAGGWHRSGEHHIFIFDADTGAIVARLGPFPRGIADLEVSPAGDRLAVGLGGANGVRVWETGGWRQVTEDKDYGDDVYGLSFAADGRLAATGLDGHIRLYAADGRLTTKAKAPGGAQPFGIAFAPDGTRLAVGYGDTTRVDVLSGQTLAPLHAAETSGVDSGDLSKVAWLPDGARLAAAGGFQIRGESPILVWADGGKGARQTLPGPKNTVMDLAAWGGGLAFGAGGPAFGLLGADGKRALFRGPPMADLRGKRHEHLLVSADGRRVRFGLQIRSADPVLFDAAALSLAPAPTAPAGLHQADTAALKIEGWDGTAPTLQAKGWLGTRAALLPLGAYETARSLAIAPDAHSFVLGAEWSLRRFDKDGKQLWEKPVPAIAWGVNLARDGRLIVAAYGDGTIRWHRTADGAELLALFIHVPDDPKAEKRWVLWTPEGYYTASPGGEGLIGWHVNRGLDQAADFYPAETFRSTFHRPDLVQAALDKV